VTSKPLSPKEAEYDKEEEIKERGYQEDME